MHYKGPSNLAKFWSIMEIILVVDGSSSSISQDNNIFLWNLRNEAFHF